MVMLVLIQSSNPTLNEESIVPTSL